MKNFNNLGFASVIIIAVAVVVVLGFIAGFALKESVGACTKMACGPLDPVGRQEVPCNRCGVSDPIFVTGLVNFEKSCSGQEIWVFENGRKVDQRVEIQTCRYRTTSGLVSLLSTIKYEAWALFFQDDPIETASTSNTTENKILSPVAGEQWQAGKQHTIKWAPSGKGTIALAVINRSFSSGYRYNICSSIPPYPCELPDTGEFIWTAPPDDGHNEWGISSEYQIILEYPKSQPATPLVSDKFSITSDKPVTSISLNKIFSQESGLYSIKYPEGWSVQSAFGDSVGVDDFTAAHAARGIVIRYFNSNYGQEKPKQVSSQWDIELGGVGARREEIIKQDGTKITRVRTIQPYKGYTYHIELEDAEYLPIYNTMLQTFKFTK